MIATRRQIIKLILSIFAGVSVFSGKIGSGLSAAYAKAKKVLLPKGTEMETLISKNPARLDASELETSPMSEFDVMGQTVHQVGIPFHFGWRWPASGSEESVNVLVTTVTDPVAEIPEFKAFMVNLSKLTQG